LYGAARAKESKIMIDRSVGANRGASNGPARAHGRAPLTALLVDDEPDDRALATHELRARFEPLEVEEAPDAMQLERALRAGKFDAAIVDYKLRWTDGLTVLRRLKAGYPGRPVVMFTASGNEEIAVEAMRAGLDDYVLKSPRHAGRLADAVERALGSARERGLLRSLEDRYRGFFDRLPVGAFRLSPEGHFIDANPQVARLLGASPAELVGARFEDFLADAAGRTRWHAALSTGHIDHFETPITRTDGLERWVQIETVAPRAPEQAVLFLEGVIVDVTERRWTAETEQLVAEAAERLAASFASRTALTEIARLALPVLGSYCRIDLESAGGAVHTVALARRDASRSPVGEAQDWTEGHAGPRTWPARADSSGHDVVVVGDLEEPDLAGALLTDEQRSTLLTAGCRSVAIVPMIARGRSVGTLTIGAANAHQLTAQQVWLATRLASSAAMAIDNEHLYREAKDAVASRDAFIAIAAHELKTPLATLYGHVQLLERNATPEALERGRAAIERQCERMLALVQRMLEMSRLRVGQFELELAPCDIGEIVATIVERAATLAPGRLLLERRPAPLVRADRLRVEEVVTNLIDNAMRYSPRGAPVEVSVGAEGDRVLVSVLDHGPGIPDALRPRVFTPFARESSAVRAPGLGLGLWIAKEIVQRHGGHIGFRSELNQGTTFFFSLHIEEVPHGADTSQRR
jgi:PAS domain S-box-containing protein